MQRPVRGGAKEVAEVQARGVPPGWLTSIRGAQVHAGITRRRQEQRPQGNHADNNANEQQHVDPTRQRQHGGPAPAHT